MTLPPQLSLLMTRAVLAAGTSLAHDTVNGAGQVIEGGVWSFTVITWVHEFELPHSSVAR